MTQKLTDHPGVDGPSKSRRIIQELTDHPGVTGYPGVTDHPRVTDYLRVDGSSSCRIIEGKSRRPVSQLQPRLTRLPLVDIHLSSSKNLPLGRAFL